MQYDLYLNDERIRGISATSLAAQLPVVDPAMSPLRIAYDPA